MAQLVRAPPCHGGGRRFDPDPGRFIYANSEPQPNEKYSCAVSVAIARQNSRSVFYLVLNCFTADSEFICVWDLSSAGRASALQAEGHRFEPCRSHIFLYARASACAFFYANSEPQLNAKYSCAASIAIAR